MPRPQDHFGRKARAEGYPARSVFKLREILEKFPLLRPRARVLDIGAAPGSFSILLLEKLKGGGEVTGVDLAPAIAVPAGTPGYLYISGDIFEEGVYTRIRSRAPFDLIVSDAAPATTGTRELDAAQSMALAERVLDIAADCLSAGGSLAVKIFQGAGEREYLARLRSRFKTARGFKPQASRSESFETYYIGMGFIPG
ncbi:MAG: RlmE family RNA methyltransferase [Spirochaetales bacterium]|nr:RlmE family RNA methyltransferase [Spirochaetales bacterium]